MALESNATFLPTMNEFSAHWELVNAAITPDLTAAAEGVAPATLGQFNDLRDSLQGHMNAIIGKLNEQEIARGDLRLKKQRLLRLLGEFLANMDAFYTSTSLYSARPKTPSLTEGQDAFTRPLVDMATLWETMNTRPAPAGVVLPLVLAEGTTQDSFKDEVADLAALYIAERKAAVGLVLARAERDVDKDRARQLMKGYRQAVPARCSQHPALLASLPDLSPKPGHTPEPVPASATFQEPNKAKVVYEASEDADLQGYELRGHPGTDYDEDDAVVLDSNLPADPREFLTSVGLTQPGASVALKVVVKLKTGNEASSPAMVVTRPED